MSSTGRLCLALFGALLSLQGMTAQTAYVPVRHPVYDYLDRLETRYQTGMPSFVRPLARMDVAAQLDRVRRLPDLSPYDREEIEHYAREFQEELLRLHATDTLVTVPDEGRWHLAQLRVTTPVPAHLAVDLVAAGTFIKRQDAADVFARTTGIRARGYAGSTIGFAMLWTEHARKGIAYDVRSSRVPDQGVVRGPGSLSSFEYEIAEGQFTWSNAWLRIGIDKHDRWQGSGRAGAIILSDKAPSYPALSLQVRLADWLHFDYAHGWLFSDSLDLDRTISGSGVFEQQRIFENKFHVTHSVTVRPSRGLQVALGESIIYSDALHPLFLIPVISFRAADRWTRASTGNSQFFADARWTPIPGLTVYATGYVDELDASKIFTPDAKDFDYQVAYTTGLLATDLHLEVTGIASETHLEFSRVYPYVYANPKLTQQYTSHQVVLGHWMGSNADLLHVMHRAHLSRSLAVQLTARLLRSGEWREFVPGSPRHQPAFLYGHEYSVFTIGGGVEWMPWHDVSVAGEFANTTLTRGPRFTSSPWVEGVSVRFRAAYGVY